MKSCNTFGDLTSDRASENYVTVQVCDECIEQDRALKEESPIIQVGPLDISYGDECAFCGKTIQDEKSE